MYKVQISLNNEIFEAQDQDLLGAFNKLKLPEYPKTLAKLTVSKGEKRVEKVFNIPKLKRFARNEITRGVWAKLLSTVFPNG